MNFITEAIYLFYSNIYHSEEDFHVRMSHLIKDLLLKICSCSMGFGKCGSSYYY